MKSTIMKGILIVALSGFSGLASALVYEVNLSVGTGSALGTITTDDTFGVLSSSNVLDWNIALDGNPGNIFTLFGPSSGNNSNLLLSGLDFIASATTLTFNFSGSGVVLFQNPSNGSGINYLCFTGSGNACGNQYNSINLGTDVWGVNHSSQEGTQVVANVVSPVPEPETYGMLLAGLGLIGFMARRSREDFSF